MDGGTDKMRAIIIILMLATMANAQTLTIDGMGDRNFGVEICDTTQCIEYNQSQQIPINTTYDYIVKIKPVSTDTTSELSTYFLGDNVYVNIILLMVFIAFLIMLVTIIGDVQ